MSMRLTHQRSANVTSAASAATQPARKSLLRRRGGGETVLPNDFSNE
jgi:hypothetical protein